jgi:geranylgeranyl diphosphate synthase type I
MTLESYIQILLPAIEDELRRVVNQTDKPEMEGLYHILAYHLGWEGDGAGGEAQGKRLRPMMVLLTTAAAGGQWERALPAAAAVELVHNFSLIHDDIEDNSPLRRGRSTIWKKWGVAQAINAGDALFTLAHLSLLRLEETMTAKLSLQAAHILQETCLKLTQGQYMDIAYESQMDLPIEAYWPMVSGKTAALLSACTELGALVAEVNKARRESYRQFGYLLGLAFQAQDDLLGIWGDASLTGKSADSDLLTGKKTLPVLFGLNQKGLFAERWAKGSVTGSEVLPLATLLEIEGARTYTQETTERLTQQALQTLEEAEPAGEAGQALFDLAKRLLSRKT